MTKVTISIDGNKLDADFNNSDTAKVLLEKFPLKVTMMNLYSREMTYRFSESLPAKKAKTSGYEVGDIGYWKPRHIGIIGFVLAICLMYVGIKLGNMIFYLAFVILAGTMQGVAYSSSLNALLKRVIKSESTGLLSIVYMISYAGAGLPSFIAGKVSHTFNFYQITLGYVILVILVGIVVVLSLNNIRKKTI